MKKTTLAILALTLGLGAVSPVAFAKTHKLPLHRVTTADLNREQLAKIHAATDMAIANPPSGDAYVGAMNNPPSPETTTVVVAAPPHDSSDQKQPDTNPPSTGTPSVDTPYVAVTPAKAPDGPEAH